MWCWEWAIIHVHLLWLPHGKTCQSDLYMYIIYVTPETGFLGEATTGIYMRWVFAGDQGLQMPVGYVSRDLNPSSLQQHSLLITGLAISRNLSWSTWYIIFHFMSEFWPWPHTTSDIFMVSFIPQYLYCRFWYPPSTCDHHWCSSLIFCAFMSHIINLKFVDYDSHCSFFSTNICHVLIIDRQKVTP